MGKRNIYRKILALNRLAEKHIIYTKRNFDAVLNEFQSPSSFPATGCSCLQHGFKISMIDNLTQKSKNNKI